MSGQEAIDKIKSGKTYDIIFMDHMMPEMDGIEAAKQIRELGFTSAIVALTANAVSGQADMFLHNGFDEFISKPIDIRQLNAILNKFVRDKQPPEVIEAARRQKAELSGSANLFQADSMLEKSFIRDAQKAVDWLQEHIHNDNLEDEEIRKFTVIVHGIKSSLWNIGEETLSEIALKLEKGGRNYDKVLIKTATPEFLEKLRELLIKFVSKQDGDSYAHDAVDIGDLCEKLHAIQEICADYDRKGALDLIGRMQYSSKETKTVLDNIMAYVIHSEFEKAGNAAAAYAGVLAPEESG